MSPAARSHIQNCHATRQKPVLFSGKPQARKHGMQNPPTKSSLLGSLYLSHVEFYISTDILLAILVYPRQCKRLLVHNIRVQKALAFEIASNGSDLGL